MGLDQRTHDVPVARERRRGRPPLPDGGKLLPVSTNVSQADFDLLCEEARRRRMPMAEVLREIIAHGVEKADFVHA